MKLKVMTTAVLCAGLAACGGTDAGGGGTTATPTPGTVTGLGAAKVLNEDFQATRIEYDAAADEMIIESIPFDDEVFEGRYTRTPSLDRGAYRAYASTRGIDQYVAYFDESASGAVSAAIVQGGNYLGHGYRGAMYQRNGSVTMPATTQRAFYNGDYIGSRSNETEGGFHTVTGDADMEVDFSDNTVRGSISNRQVVYSSNAGSAVPTISSTVQFGDSTLDRTNGTFSGNLSQTADTSGTYEGMLADGTGNASEIVGTTLIEEFGGQENGVFIAVQ